MVGDRTWLSQTKYAFVENKRILKMLEISLIWKLMSNIEMLYIVLTLENFKNHYMYLFLKSI